MEVTFFRLDIELVLQQSTDDEKNMLETFRKVLGENQGVTEIDEDYLASRRTSFMGAWKTAGLLVKMNGLTRYSKWPKGGIESRFSFIYFPKL